MSSSLRFVRSVGHEQVVLERDLGFAWCSSWSRPSVAQFKQVSRLAVGDSTAASSNVQDGEG